MLATSTSVVIAPPFFNFATPLLHDAKNFVAVSRIDVDVHTILFEREEIEAIPALAEHSRAHDSIVASRESAVFEGDMGSTCRRKRSGAVPINEIGAPVIPTVADPLEVGSLDMLLDELRLFASHASLPIDDVELMQLAARYLEDDALFDTNLDVQTYAQLLLTAKQAAAHGVCLWLDLS
jgi:hypothetical protein